MIVNVQYPVTRATVTVPSTVLNSQSQVTIVVTGSTNIVMDVAFGEVDAVQIKGSGLEGYLQVQDMSFSIYNIIIFEKLNQSIQQNNREFRKTVDTTTFVFCSN